MQKSSASVLTKQHALAEFGKEGSGEQETFTGCLWGMAVRLLFTASWVEVSNENYIYSST